MKIKVNVHNRKELVKHCNELLRRLKEERKEKRIEKAMKRGVSNFYMGRTRKQAIKFLERPNLEIYDDYRIFVKIDYVSNFLEALETEIVDEIWLDCYEVCILELNKFKG